MKKIVMMGVLAAGGVFANIVPKLTDVTNVAPGMISCEADGCTYTYSANLSADAMIKGNTVNTQSEQFFTIYDFNGYKTGTATGPTTDWLARVQNEGVTPAFNADLGVNIQDDPGVANLTFVYAGALDIGAGSALGLFSAKSQYGPSTVFDYYAGQATHAHNGGLTQHSGQVRVPAPGGYGNDAFETPEPMTMAMMGAGLTALAILGRRHRRAAK